VWDKKLDKALYGLVESAKLFYERLSGVLKEAGFLMNPYDLCGTSLPLRDSSRCAFVSTI
jgi:hypothetical protein